MYSLAPLSNQVTLTLGSRYDLHEATHFSLLFIFQLLVFSSQAYVAAACAPETEFI
jgi:hypothetical protein